MTSMYTRKPAAAAAAAAAATAAATQGTNLEPPRYSCKL